MNRDAEPPDRDRDCGGGSGEAGGSHRGLEDRHEETRTRCKTINGMRGTTPATSSPSEASPNGVSVNDCPSDISAEEARNNLSKKVNDLRDPRNLPALGGALNYAQAAGQNAKANKPSTYELVLELLSFDNSRNLQLFVDKVLFTHHRLLAQL